MDDFDHIPRAARIAGRTLGSRRADHVPAVRIITVAIAGGLSLCFLAMWAVLVRFIL